MTNMTTILELQAVSKTYQSGNRNLQVLGDITFQIGTGETVAIVGPSGSGKTTLLGLCAGLDNPTSGEISLCDQQLNGLSEDERAKVRNQKIGFIFSRFSADTNTDRDGKCMCTAGTSW